MAFVRNGDEWNIINSAMSIHDSIEVGVYKINIDNFKNCSLTRIKDKFELPLKVYSLDNEDEKFEYIVKKCAASTKNVGIILNGEKGSGKSVMAKRICNALNMPVIIVENKGKDDNLKMLDYMTRMDTDMVCLLDEFEKNFDNESQTAFLSFMDGLYNGKKKIFLITSNERRYDSNIIGRMGRVCYLVQFGKITDKSSVIRFFHSELPELTSEQLEQIVTYLGRKENLTIDTFTQIAEEIRCMGFEDFINVGAGIMNLEDVLHYYSVYHYCPDKSYSTNEIRNLDFDSFIKYMDLDNASYDARKAKAEAENDEATIEECRKVSELIDEVTIDYARVSLAPEQMKVGKQFRHGTINEIKRGSRGKYIKTVDNDGDETFMLIRSEHERCLFH